MKPTFRKTAVAMAVAGVAGTVLVPEAEANVVNLSWRGAFTFLGESGAPIANIASDYMAGYYGNGDSSSGNGGAPYFPGNVAPGADCTTYGPACVTAAGWYGNRTPVSGTMSFDTLTGAGVGTINPYFFLGDTPGSGANTAVAAFQSVTFQAIDSIGTLLGSMVFAWNGVNHSVSIVMDASGMFASLPAPPTSTITGVGALPATDGTNFGTAEVPKYYPLGPSPVATKTLNTGAGCDGLTLATQVNAYTIVTNTANVATCATGMTDDGIGGDPMTSTAFYGFNANFDITSVHLEPSVQCLTCPPPPEVPVPPAMWLFGSGLAGLSALARRKRKA